MGQKVPWRVEKITKYLKELISYTFSLKLFKNCITALNFLCNFIGLSTNVNMLVCNAIINF